VADCVPIAIGECQCDAYLIDVRDSYHIDARDEPKVSSLRVQLVYMKEGI
jgi:hypothetical protein